MMFFKNRFFFYAYGNLTWIRQRGMYAFFVRTTGINVFLPVLTCIVSCPNYGHNLKIYIYFLGANFRNSPSLFNARSYRLVYQSWRANLIFLKKSTIIFFWLITVRWPNIEASAHCSFWPYRFCYIYIIDIIENRTIVGRTHGSADCSRLYYYGCVHMGGPDSLWQALHSDYC